MSTDALELALALHQAPIQRFALRDRPLPANMDEVLQLASAMQPQLQNAAARFSESEETIVEAVRFYLQQVLFEPGTDAYRIFGVAPNADFKQVRQHHIWLQRWLHPDRRGEDWEAALATKVNWAWQQLRNESSREEYDQLRQQRNAQSGAHPAKLAQVQVPAWSAAPVASARNWLRRGLLGGFLAVCAGLLYLAATRQDRVDPDALAVQSSAADSEIQPRLPFNHESVKSAAVSIKATPLAPTGVADAGARTPNPAVTEQADSLIQSRTSVQSQANPPLVEPPAMSRTVGMNTVRPLVAQSEEVLLVRPAAVAAEESGVAAPASATRSRPRQAGVASVGHAPVAVAAMPAQEPISAAKPASTVEVKTDPSQAMAVHQPPLASAIEPHPSGVDEAIAEKSASVATAPVPTTPSPELSLAELDRTTLRRFELARARVTSMVSYFRSPDANPPQWQDQSGRHAVAREREVLRQRSGEHGISRFVLDPPVWQISHSAVSLKANYHTGTRHRSAESGRLLLDMVWLDDKWTITHIELSPRS